MDFLSDQNDGNPVKHNLRLHLALLFLKERIFNMKMIIYLLQCQHIISFQSMILWKQLDQMIIIGYVKAEEDDMQTLSCLINKCT